MLYLYLNDKEAVLPVDFSITLNLQNDFLNDKSEDSSYPFSLSVSANRHIFRFPDRIENTAYPSTFSARLFAGPYLLLDGSAYIETLEGDNMEIYITTSAKSFWKQAGEWYVGTNLHHDSNMWTSEIVESLTYYYRYVFAPLYDTVNNKLINDPEWLTYIGNKDRRPFLRVKELLAFHINQFGYTINHNALDNIVWFKNLLIISQQSYELNTSYYPLPKITVRELIEELELRFAVRFQIDETTKMINIVQFNDTLDGERILSGFVDPQISFLSEEDYNKKYAFSDKKTDDPIVAPSASIFPYPFLYPDSYEKSDCLSTQIGKYDKYGAIGEAIGDDNSTDFRLGIWKGMVNNYPTMDADELSWNYLYDNFHRKRIIYLKRKKEYTFNIYHENISILYSLPKLFNRPIVVDFKKYLGISAEITLTSEMISEFSLKCAPL